MLAASRERWHNCWVSVPELDENLNPGKIISHSGLGPQKLGADHARHIVWLAWLREPFMGALGYHWALVSGVGTLEYILGICAKTRPLVRVFLEHSLDICAREWPCDPASGTF